ncbi:MAG: hypothetical protein M3R38_33300 [Actinomycetota bacterium]|nr:hypothetical protein [Actinomycetota bacterium]
MSSTPKPRYVRFGHLPASGRSWNADDKRREAGVSVYAGRLAEPDLFRIYTSDLSVEGLGLLISFAAVDRPAFFVEGEEVGSGHDGEPLLEAARSRPVPRSCAIVPTDGLAQPALALWSKGPRDGSGFKYRQWRLSDSNLGYVPSGMNLVSEVNARGIRGHVNGTVDKRKKKAERKARRKNRT